MSARAPAPSSRPSLSPALLTLACAWGASWLAGTACAAAHFGRTWVGVNAPLLAALLVGVGILGCALLAALLRPARVPALLCALGLAAGMASGWAGAASTLARGEALTQSPVSAYEYLVETDPSSSAMGSVGFEATASGGELGPSWVRVRVTLPEDQARELGDELRMGEVVHLVGAWDPYEDDEWGTSMLLRGSAVAVSAKRCTPVGPQGGAVGAVRSLRARLLAALGPLDTPERALLAGVVLGEQAHLSDCEVYRDFANLGLTHLVAVSGSHLSVVAGLFGVLLTRLRLRPVARFAVSAATLAAYVVISGLQPSAERSLVMVLVALAGGLGGRRSHAVSSLGIAALVMLLVEPSNVFALGFSLSVLSVLGIVCFSRLAEEWVGAVLGPLARFPSLTSALALTLVAQAFTMPLTLPTFGVLPVLSPLANVLVGPLMSALLLVGLTCVPLSALVPGAASVALVPCDCLAWCTCRLTSVLATVPHAAMAVSVSGVACAVGLAAGCAFLYLLWPRPSRRAAAVALSCCTVACVATYLAWRLLAPARVVVLDVGQGDAILVQDGARALLVDTGPNDAVLEALARNHVMHLDAVLVTHTDSDHAGGLDDLVGLVPVDRVILATGGSEHLRRTGDELLETIDALCDGRVLEVDAGDRLHVGGFTLDVIAPASAVEGGDNEDSVVSVVRYEKAGGSREAGPGGEQGRLTMLLTGDAESQVTEALAGQGLVGDVDVLKVGHHGSAPSTTIELLEMIDPELAVVSAGEGNRYGHPTQECVDAVRSYGACLLCTIECGDITLRPGEGGVLVRCQERAAC